MTDHVRQVRMILAEAEQLPNSHTRLALLEAAVRVADAHQDVELGIQTRYPLMWSARSLLRGDVLAVAFSWCLHHYDRDPSLFHGRDLLWEYELVIGQLSNLDTVSRAKLEELLADFERRLQHAGASREALLRTKRFIAPDLGDRAMAADADREMAFLTSGDPESVWWKKFYCLLFLGRDDEALALADKCMRGELGCTHWEIEYIRFSILLPLLKRGRVAEVLGHQHSCVVHMHPEVNYDWPYGDLLKSLALTGRIGLALKVYERCQRAIRDFTDPLTRLHFGLDAIVLFDRLTNLGRATIPVRLAETVPVPATVEGYRVAELHQWLLEQAADLVARFDRRNGNNYFSEELRERRALQSLALPEEH